ncbi:HD-GYP domain-containing protein [Pseudomonas sp. DTU_2021_1001937_2_SI_NGA_ILE_001]|uniref:HD-GYP domain-containing protein n=1 Tax=Pseudomonas sp. DTU_2021_1001937_2_SI_NGA_ILE_001 TaxID=3077589 RepID=UPI0028FC1325|nr:HD-GYP domain-containing protein [Pseudomonas sp. DTU_2021_1001937_2_SI_NGA_ILE_001]WNW13486.1 HD-GYP domain-containing protein [Pseudomonas sp. DTU_2021_1001937_2_SI_NGA_ILE_001]
MLRKIMVSELALGMHIHEFCRPWDDDPFWIAQIESQLNDTQVLQRIRHSGLRELWIDISRGKAPDAPPAGDTAPTSLEKELQRARQICGRARQLVMAMFDEAKMGRAMNVEDIGLLVDEIASSIMRHPHALISLSRLKNSDEYTYMHSVAVCALMVALARRMGLDEEQVRDAGVAGLMHDVGKMMMNPEILNKPGRLTDDEFQAMKSHPEAGLKILQETCRVTRAVLDVCLHHHEKFDGSGYPHGLAGDEISIFARMGAVCDVYDAVTSDRPYKKAWCAARAIREMAGWKGHFDDQVFQHFVKTVGIYPIGALVRLESERLAVVMEQSEHSLLTPRVKVIMSARTRRPLEHRTLHLGKAQDTDSIVRIESPEQWGIENYNELWAGACAV